MPFSALYGATEVEYYQITQTGAQRVVSNDFRGIDSSLIPILKDLYSQGGTIEYDQLKFMSGNRSPMTLRMGLRRLVDMGLVVPVTFGAATTAAGARA